MYKLHVLLLDVPSLVVILLSCSVKSEICVVKRPTTNEETFNYKTLFHETGDIVDGVLQQFRGK